MRKAGKLNDVQINKRKYLCPFRNQKERSDNRTQQKTQPLSRPNLVTITGATCDFREDMGGYLIANQKERHLTGKKGPRSFRELERDVFL